MVLGATAAFFPEGLWFADRGIKQGSIIYASAVDNTNW